MSDEYKPISCDIHSQYELWIMRGQEIKLAWLGDQGVMRIERVKPVDIRADNGVEYLYFQDTLVALQRIRLDHIHTADSIEPAVSRSHQAWQTPG